MEQKTAARRRTRLVAGLVVALLAPILAPGSLWHPTPAGAVLNDITTTAGTGTSGFSGDGGPGTSAQVNGPGGVTTDDDGNVYIADTYNHRIRRIDTDGTITTIAGTGTPGFSGEGTPAVNAHLAGPTALEFDRHGNLFISDTVNNRIRRIDASGTITTFAGMGLAGFSGDGGPATAAKLNEPIGLDFDPKGNLIFADAISDRIRRIDTGGTITTIAGTNVEGFSGDGGQATAATFNTPWGVAVGDDNQIYIADTNNHRIRRIDTTGKIITLAGGTGQFSFPTDIEAARDNRLYVADRVHLMVRRVDRFGNIATVAGSGNIGNANDGGPALLADLNQPSAVAIGPDGDLYITEALGHRVRRVDQAGPGQLRVTTNPAVPGEISVNGAPRDSWGLTWLEVAGGIHQVCFGPVPGFTPPPCEVVFVIEGQVTNLVGNYQPRGYLRVITEPAVPSTIRVNSLERNNWGVWTEVDPGSQQVCFGEVAGYDPPSCQSVNVTGGATTTVTGTFTPNPSAQGPTGSLGQLRVTTNPPTGSRITMGGAWRDSWGLTWLTLWSGIEQVCFDAVLYATAPPCQVVNVAAGATTTLQGQFVHHGFLRVLTNPAVGATITIDGIGANAWGVWTSRPPGAYHICFDEYPGLTAPACQDVVVTTGATTTVTGIYT